MPITSPTQQQGQPGHLMQYSAFCFAVAAFESREHKPFIVAQVLQYYEAQARTNNNRGREAACHCMAELVRKLQPDAILPYLNRILKALISAFRDDSWPVSCLLCHAVMCFAMLCCDTLPCAVLCCLTVPQENSAPPARLRSVATPATISDSSCLA